MQLKRAAIRHIEAEVYTYPHTLSCLEQMTDQIIRGGNSNVAVVTGQKSYIDSAVERRATRLADSILLQEMRRITDAIRVVYEQSKEEVKRVVWVKYGLAIDWEPSAELKAQIEGRNRFDLGPDEMAEIVSLDRATFYRYRSGFIYAIAEKLGWR